jgi:sulfur carrier protein
MTITVNGKRMDVDDGLSIDGLLAQLGVPREFTAVAVNRDVARRGDFATRALAPGDRVEIVRPMGGG